MADRNSGSGEAEMSSDGREQELQPIVVGLPAVGAGESAAEVKRKRGRPTRSGQVKAAPPSKKQKEDEDVCFICFDGGSLVLCDRRMGSEHLGKVLSKVISKLGDGKASHVPYRDSKLTRLLQSSLSGHGRVSLICTVTPSSSNSEETRNTLKFAHHTKHIEIQAAQNKGKLYMIMEICRSFDQIFKEHLDGI
ncbi:hypothetical protein POM88_013120 [Heracleum sosnowskyi]|uniref:Kinesin motor domain-containing protein n=1 Tax=Heracleum sosnowskyi TaxID=360622 RepID=A0AAD8IZD5_9APIA|nr:hypothetical protein POM88_013120 [Heracleum sosnowskyi]